MYQRNFDHITVAATGQTVTTTVSTSTGNTLPVVSDGSRARFVRFTATTPVHVRVGIGAQTAVTTDVMVVPNDPLILTVGGATHWAAIDTGTVSRVNVAPLEDS